jgi:hypothetical protein
MRPCRTLLVALAASSCAAPTDQRAASGEWVFQITLEGEAHELALRAELPSGPAMELGATPATMPFLTAVQLTTGSAPPEPLFAHDGAFSVAASSQPRSLQWRFGARAAAQRVDDADLAAWRGRGFLGSLSAFLLHPTDSSPDLPFTLHVQAPKGLAFACTSHHEGGAWHGRLDELRVLPACAFGALAIRTLSPMRPRLEVVELAPRPDANAAALDAWARDALAATTRYFGAFPVDDLLLVIVPGQGHQIRGGSARGLGGARIFVDVPLRLRAEQFAKDWVLFHEMIHLGLPSLPPAQHWLEEGSATYLEPLLQARTGRLTEQEVWTAMLTEFGQGIAGPDAGGIDADASWGRTYYGGAIFCLLADVEIRSLTDNRYSLEHALRAVVAGGGNITRMGTIEDVIAVGDRATSTTVLAKLYERMRTSKEPRELHSLWQRLGVHMAGDTVAFDDAAPLANVRRALVKGKP